MSMSQQLASVPKENIPSQIVQQSPPISVPATDSAASWPPAGILRQALMSFSSPGQLEKCTTAMSDQDGEMPKISLGLVHSVDDIRLSLTSPGTLPCSSESLTTRTVPLCSLPPGAFFTGSLPSTAVPFVSIPFGPFTQGALLSRVCTGSLPSVNEVVSSSGLSSSTNVLLTNPSASHAIDLHPSIPQPEVSSVKVMLPHTSVISSQTIASLPTKDDALTVIYSSIPKIEPTAQLVPTVPLPSMSEVKSGLTAVAQTQTSNKLQDPPSSANDITNIQTTESNDHSSQVQFNNIPTSENIKLDCSPDSSSDFSHGTSISLPAGSIPIKFHSDNSSSSDIVIPPSAGERQHPATQDISHILTIPLTSGTIESISMPNGVNSVQITSGVIANLPNSVAGLSTNQVPTSIWSSPGTSPIVTTGPTQVSSGTVALPFSRSSAVTSVVSTAPSTNMIPFTSNAISIPSSPVTTTSQESVCYAMQSPAEILSQLSKAGVLPAMSSSQVSSVLSALGSDSHMDMDTDATHHGEILPNQVLHTDKVSTLTQTDDLELTQRNVSEESMMVQQVMHMLGSQTSSDHPAIMSNSLCPDTPRQNNEGSALAEALNPKQSSSYPKIVAMVLNAPAVSHDSMSVTPQEDTLVKTKTSVDLLENTSQLPNSGISVREFLEVSNNKSSSKKSSESTSSLREMLLGSSGGTVPPLTSVFIKQEVGDSKQKAKKSRARAKKNKSSAPDGPKPKSNKRVKRTEEKTVQDNNESSSNFMDQVACFKCKFCPFLSLDKTSVTFHIQQAHMSEELMCSRQKLKCPGCSNVFFSTKSLSVHLAQDHQVVDPELQIIVDSAVKLVQENDHEEIQKDSAGQPSTKLPDVSGNKDKKLRVRNLNSEIIEPDEGNLKETDHISSSESEHDERDVNSDDPLIQQKQNASIETYDCVVANVEDTAAMSCDIPVVTVKHTYVKKRGRPRGSKNKTVDDFMLNKLPGDSENGHSPRKDYYRCNINNCAVSLRSHDNIEYHRRCHSGSEYSCPECKHIQSHWNGMSVHLWRCHLIDMELYSCDQCDYKTHSYSRLVNLHKWIHGTERPFLCDSCGKGFKNRKQLRNHKTTHKPKQAKLGECDVCGRTFNSKRMLRMHLDNVHNKLRPHLCNYCGYSASSVSSLKMHMRKHTGEKPFHCDLCEYCTADHNSLRRHKMQHTGDKPYKCPHCTYACIQSSTYKAHLKTKHPGMDSGLMFSCSICPFRSVKESNYIAHLAEHKPGAVVKTSSKEVGHKLPRVKKSKQTSTNSVTPISDGDIQLTYVSTPRENSSKLSVFEEEQITGDLNEAEEITGDIHESEEITGDLHEAEELEFKVQKEDDS